jgi:tellurite resistance protein TerA
MPIDYTKRPGAEPQPEPQPEPPPTAAPVSLSKVRLTKAAPSVSLSKHGGARGMMHVNLNWNARAPEKGFFKKTQQLDLDLGCLYEFADGTKGVVQALGNSFTAQNRRGKQLLRLDGDDRSGQVSGGENLFVDLTDPSEISRILVFALIYEGAANWAAANGVATLTPAGAAPLEVLLDDPRDGARICAIALISNRNGEIVVQREVNYINGAQRALDQAYGWGMNWAPGRK